MLFDSVPPSSLLLYGILCVFLWVGVQAGHKYYKLRKLGKRATVTFSWTPLLGIDIVYSLLRHSRAFRTYEWWMSMCAKMGYTFEMVVFCRRVIFTAEPENIKALLSSQFKDFGKGEEFHNKWYPFLGDSVFATDGMKWHNSRHLMRPQFIKARVSNLQTFEIYTQKLISIVKQTKGKTVDIQDLLLRMSLDITTHFLLGSSVDSLSKPQVEFAKAFSVVQKVHTDIQQLGRFHHFVPKKGYKESLEIMNSFIHQFVDKAVKMSPAELGTKESQNYNFLHELVRFTKDPKFLRDQIVAVLLAGRDSTAAALSWMLYELATHPDDIQKLRREILATVGPVEAPTYEDLKNMRFLQCVINEGMRLYPGVGINIRYALKDTSLPIGGGRDGKEVAVPKGTPVAYGSLIMQRRKDLFGPDALEFKPGRWENRNPEPWSYLPFNAGPRVCLGQQYAITEMGYCLVRLLQAFEEVHYMGEGPPRMKIEIITFVGGGLHLSFKEAGC